VFSISFLRQIIQLPNRIQILREARWLEFRIGLAEIVVRIDSLSSVPPRIEPPIAHVPCTIRETFISVPEITAYSIFVILSYDMKSTITSFTFVTEGGFAEN
jgi:hypothetical protein